MDANNLHEIVSKLVGPINATGSHGTDELRLANLTILCDLAEKIIDDIKEVADDNHECMEKSVIDITLKAMDFIGECKHP